MANVFLTGASGMIGVAVAQALLKKNHKVIAVDSKSNELDGTDPNYVFVQCDITDSRMINDTLDRFNIDTFVHLACTVDNDLDAMVTDAEMKTSKSVDKFIYSMADKAGIRNFILTSTTQVYGLVKGREPIRESLPEKGITNYSDLKLTSEKLFLKAFRKSSAIPVIARIAPIYTAEFTDNLREHVYDKKDDVAYVYGEGEYSFSFCCLYNYVDFISGIVEGPSGKYEGIYNICDSQPTTAKEILDYEREHHRIGAVIQQPSPSSISINKAKSKIDYRYFDPNAALANWYIDNTAAKRISTFRWNLKNTK